ncbi:restriction endonuclease subunit S [Deefgea piscis]|uniref:restriction endonuclease subunit S n=1 Tax=Deefgea piscis TaxID=2739061 RepID=UPI001C82331A|nr:restriction endonuclease subunit S [Deefgea piscis]QZA80123.1 restriction endonuclease subunit S [Deefgea piscis]
MSAENLVPAIRFKGFSGEWEEKKFKDIVANLSGGASIAPSDYQDKGIRTIPKGAVNSTGIAELSGSKYVSLDFYEKNISSKVSSGDLVTSLRDLVPTAPNMGRIVKVKTPKEDFLMPQGVYKIDLEDGIDEYFLISYSNSEVFRKIISSEKNGSTQVHIRNGEFLSIEIIKPKSEEQKEIGRFFQKIDTLVAQHQQKHDKLLSLKISLLEKMFPKQGKKEPEIRFKGFSGEWEDQALADVADLYDGTHQTPKYTSSGVMFLSVENIKDLKSNKYISNEDFEKGFKVFPKKNDVLMTRIGDVGTANVVDSDEPKAYYVTLALLKHKVLDPYFLKSSIASERVRKDIWHRTLHIAFPKKINMNEISKVIIPTPSSEKEQENIGHYFQQLDALINQHQAQINKLNSVKQACLEKMFV